MMWPLHDAGITWPHTIAGMGPCQQEFYTVPVMILFSVSILRPSSTPPLL